MQGSELIRQVPAFERGSLIQSPDFLLPKGQIVYRVEHKPARPYGGNGG